MKTKHFSQAILLLFLGLTVISCGKDPDAEQPTIPSEENIIEADVTSQGKLTLNAENASGATSAEGSSKLIDGDTTTKFYVAAPPANFYMQIEFDSAKLIGAYTITTANDWDTRDPRNWTLTASNDGQNWIELDRQMGELFFKRRLTQRYDFKNTTKYKYYRWNITALYNDVNFQVSEWRLIQVPTDKQKISPVTYIDSSTQNGLTLYYINKTGQQTLSYQSKMINTFFTNYPKLLQDFNPDALKKLNFIVDTAYTGVAYAFGSVIAFGGNYMKNNPNDVDVVTHEIMHIIQAYPGGVAPVWLSEGIADYVRDKYALDNAGAGWSLPNFSANQSYTDSYRVTARFLKWIELHIKPGFVKEVDAAIRTKVYTSNYWLTATGKTVDQLWAQYASKPTL
ncbi:MAG: hypothetical protein DI598_01810 [Pseudopedobacter saltans]|uniref:F5/8 type C domain-containing protein n=1 Tax=Pseudopedobacter saltans TaxID=151895 RepID=A0A2W5H994_9SPHI|nr:MAG: hypothetical protein DI598_01810 [Pseudopedobacter saltans]